MASRWVVVDDTDANIAYTGPWFQDQGSQDTAGNFGPTYKSTLHGANDNASLSFAFSGTSVSVIGSNNLRNDSGVLDPTWECFVDHISIGKTTPFQFAENNWVFCEQAVLVDGPHLLTVNATVANKQTFWFDRIQYVPSAGMSLASKAILVDSGDKSLQYGAGWGPLGGTANSTSRTGSAFSFEFDGVSLAWYGFIPTELPHAATTGAYSIDGQSAVSFLLKGLPAESITIYNQKFFETTTLPYGHHKITVLYQGSGETTPLTLDYLIVQNGTVPVGSSTSTSPGPSPTGKNAGSNTNDTTSSKSNVGAIAGGVIGGLGLILLACLLFLCYRRKQRKQQNLRDKEMHYEDKTLPATLVEPFLYDSAGHHSTTALPNNGPDYPSYLGSYPSYVGSYPSTDPVRTDANTRTTGGGHTHGSMPSLGASEMQSSVMAPTTSSGFTSPSNMNATTGHGPGEAPTTYVPYQPMPTKLQREAQATAAFARPLQPQRPGQTSPSVSDFSSEATGGTGTSGSGRRLVVHEDSGIRLPQRGNSGGVVEVPPMYTPG